MADRQERSGSARQLVDELLQVSEDSEVVGDELESLRGALIGLRWESSGRAVRRLISTVGERRYGDWTASELHRSAQGMRNAVLHGGGSSGGDVGAVGAQLGRLVSHLIAGVDVIDQVEARLSAELAAGSTADGCGAVGGHRTAPDT